MEQTVERAGEPFELAEQLTVVGRKPQVGDLAPDFLLERFDAAASAMRQVRPADSGGTVRLLDVVDSVDTTVCQVKREEWRLLHCAVFVVDRSDRIAYAEYVPDSDERAE